MRIVAGRNRGRPLLAPPGDTVRPTSDRARESLFNILAHRGEGGVPAFLDAAVLDAFAGTGALGLEALSRGAKRAFFIENDTGARACLRRNIETLGEAARAHILPADAVKPPRATASCGLVFLDPPYGKGLAIPALAALAAAGWIAPGAVCAVEIGAKEQFSAPSGFTIADKRRYGAARLVILKAA